MKNKYTRCANGKGVTSSVRELYSCDFKGHCESKFDFGYGEYCRREFDRTLQGGE